MRRRVIKGIFFSVVGIFLSLTLIGFLFQDRIIDAALQSIRKSIRSRITIGDASFSLVKDFPYASIRFSDISILSTKDIALSDFAQRSSFDTLLNAQSLNLKVNLLDLLSDKISVKQVVVKNGSLNLLYDRQGNDNFHIIRISGLKNSKTFSLNIDGVRLENTQLLIYNLSKRFILNNQVERLTCEGNFSTGQFNTHTEATLTIQQLSVEGVTYVTNKQFQLSGRVKAKSYKSYSLKNFVVAYKNNRVKLDGGFSLSENTYVDLVAIGKKLVLKEINELIPRLGSSLSKVNFEGEANLKAKATGYLTSSKWPFIYGEFEVKGGKSEILKDRSIASVNLIGTFSNGKGTISNSFVQVESFRVNSSFGDFEGKFTLTNFRSPLVSLSTNFNLFLSDLNKAYRIDSTNTLDGTVIGSITADGNVNFDSISVLRIMRLINNGNFKLSEIKYPVSGSIYSISRGEVSFVPTEAKANLNFDSDAINGDIRVAINNFYDGLMEAMPFSGTITANTASINFDKLLALNFKADKSNHPKDINVANLTIGINSKSALLRGIPMDNLAARMEKNGPSITLTDLRGKALGGTIDMMGKVELNPNKTIGADIFARVDSIDIETLFASFNNFNQKVLTSDNIKGMAFGDITFRGTFTEKGALLPKTVDCVTNLTIENGRLVRFAPAQKLSKFINLKELEDIQFASLKNQITIRNSVINIPAMYVGSSALNLGIIGTHGFNGSYSYRVKLALKDVLFNKARSGLKKQVSQADFESNTLLYFQVEGDAHSSKVHYDWGGKSWNLPNITPESKPEAKSEVKPAASSRPYKVVWGDDQPAAAATAPAPQRAKPATEQPQSTSYREEQALEKKATKKEEAVKGFKVTWEDE